MDIESLPTIWETLFDSNKYLVRFWIRSCLKLFGTGFFKREQKILHIFWTFSTFSKDVFFSPLLKRDWLSVGSYVLSHNLYLTIHSEPLPMSWILCSEDHFEDEIEHWVLNCLLLPSRPRATAYITLRDLLVMEERVHHLSKKCVY